MRADSGLCEFMLVKIPAGLPLTITNNPGMAADCLHPTDAYTGGNPQLQRFLQSRTEFLVLMSTQQALGSRHMFWIHRSLCVHDANHPPENSENPSFLQIREKELKALFLLFSVFSLHVLIKGVLSSY